MHEIVLYRQLKDARWHIICRVTVLCYDFKPFYGKTYFVRHDIEGRNWYYKILSNGISPTSITDVCRQRGYTFFPCKQ